MPRGVYAKARRRALKNRDSFCRLRGETSNLRENTQLDTQVNSLLGRCGVTDEQVRFEYWKNDIKNKYHTYTGTRPNDRTVRNFTEEDQVERYAKDLAFWTVEQGKLNPLTCSTTYWFVSDNRLKSISRVESKFTEEQQERIFKRVAELVST